MYLMVTQLSVDKTLVNLQFLDGAYKAKWGLNPVVSTYSYIHVRSYTH